MNVTQELKLRNNCRAGLVGVLVNHVPTSTRFVVFSTSWNARTELVIHGTHADANYPASECDLVTDWPVRCCPRKTTKPRRPTNPARA